MSSGKRSSLQRKLQRFQRRTFGQKGNEREVFPEGPEKIGFPVRNLAGPIAVQIEFRRPGPIVAQTVLLPAVLIVAPGQVDVMEVQPNPVALKDIAGGAGSETQPDLRWLL